jgi:hypothetical protein
MGFILCNVSQGLRRDDNLVKIIHPNKVVHVKSLRVACDFSKLKNWNPPRAN